MAEIEQDPPKCLECKKPLTEYAYSQPTEKKYGWVGNGYFCTKDCAAYWAVSKARNEEQLAHGYKL
jgi:hypothetical protein